MLRPSTRTKVGWGQDPHAPEADCWRRPRHKALQLVGLRMARQFGDAFIAPRRPASTSASTCLLEWAGESEPGRWPKRGRPPCLLHHTRYVLILGEDAAKTHRMDPNIAGIDKPSIRAALDFTNPTAVGTSGLAQRLRRP